ncbi:MAG: hypothetical protein J5J06_03160 [Phycisphaerae bacterium]|nr:hypothetical protein [Phycisphaerae bacterium]
MPRFKASLLPFPWRCFSSRTGSACIVLFLAAVVASPSSAQAPDPTGDPAANPAPESSIAALRADGRPDDQAPPDTRSPEELVRAADEALAEFDKATSVREREQARKQLDEAVFSLVQRAPTDPRLLLYEAQRKVWAGNGGQALALAQKFVRTPEGASDWRGHRLIGDLLVNDFAQLARSSYERALQLHPDEPSILLGLSICDGKLGRRDEAVEWARRAAAVRPTPNTLGQLANAQALAEQWSDAVSSAERAVALARERALAEPGQRPPLETLDRLLGLSVEISRQRMRRQESKVASDQYVELYRKMSAQADNQRVLRDDDIHAALVDGVLGPEADPSNELLGIFFDLSLKLGKCDAARKAQALLADRSPGEEAALSFDRLRARCGDGPATPASDVPDRG